MLRVEDLNVSYGQLQVLWDISIDIDDESIVAIIGTNGSGKTTLLKTISGLLEPTSGTIEIMGQDAQTLSPYEIVEHGFVQISEERNLFTNMKVRENLRMGSFTKRDDFEDTLEEVYSLFPVLEDRMNQTAGTLSGGEQQMLAIGRGLMAQPKILALDEPSSALAPQLVDQVFELIERISEETTILLVEQRVDKALAMADTGYLLENGRIVDHGTGDELLESDTVKEAYLQ